MKSEKKSTELRKTLKAGQKSEHIDFFQRYEKALQVDANMLRELPPEQHRMHDSPDRQYLLDKELVLPRVRWPKHTAALVANRIKRRTRPSPAPDATEKEKS
jgi:hypothetical protein